MKIRIEDIPVEGRELEFELDIEALNERIEYARKIAEVGTVLPPSYTFIGQGAVDVGLELKGSSVLMTGHAHADYITSCARCAENTSRHAEVKIDLILKPHSERAARDPVEDVAIGFYEGKEIDLAARAEEFLVLALPYTVLCSETCKGLCPGCGENLNSGNCICPSRDYADERFAVLRQLKLH